MYFRPSPGFIRYVRSPAVGFRSRRFSRDLFYCDIWLVSGDFIPGFATGLMSLIGLRAITGIFEAPAFPTNNRMVTSWFPEHERASAVGFIRLVSLSVWRFDSAADLDSGDVELALGVHCHWWYRHYLVADLV